MGVVGGQFKGFNFQPPKVMPARPTTDYAKEGIFNILQNIYDWESISALDLFGGTGSISYELASRGCLDITCVEMDAKLISFIQKNRASLKIEKECKVIKMDVFRFINSQPGQYDLIFADPPYQLAHLETLPDLIFANALLKEDGLFVMEHDSKNRFEDHPHYNRSRNYGNTIFTLFS
jgi:16S rRNA (guanine966-N2)-methyltransferase